MTSDRRTARRHELEHAVAPHVDPAWAEAVILVLRLLGVGGDRIGAALAEVDAHCVDSGESAADAFGEPVAYARSLGLPTQAETRGEAVRTALPALLQVLGLFVVLAAVPSLRRGETAELTTGNVGALALLTGVVVGVGLAGEAALRLVLDRPVVAALLAAGVVGTGAALLVLGDASVLRLPATAMLGVGVVALLAGAAWSLVGWRDVEDPLVVPNGGEVATRGGWATRLIVAWQVPAAAVLLGVVAWFLA